MFVREKGKEIRIENSYKAVTVPPYICPIALTTKTMYFWPQMSWSSPDNHICNSYTKICHEYQADSLLMHNKNEALHLTVSVKDLTHKIDQFVTFEFLYNSNVFGRSYSYEAFNYLVSTSTN